METFSQRLNVFCSPSLVSMKLDQFLKWKGIVSTGGEAKYLINTGQVLVNGEVEIRRVGSCVQGI